jgi:hypothetical protein
MTAGRWPPPIWAKRQLKAPGCVPGGGDGALPRIAEMPAPAACRSRPPYQSAPGMVSDVLPGLFAAGGWGESPGTRTKGNGPRALTYRGRSTRTAAPARDEDRTDACVFRRGRCAPAHQQREPWPDRLRWPRRLRIRGGNDRIRPVARNDGGTFPRKAVKEESRMVCAGTGLPSTRTMY